MKAMLFTGMGKSLQPADVPRPVPSEDQVLIRVAACAICRTDLHILDGELAHPKLPLILGHEIVGEIEEIGDGVDRFKPGDRVGVPWLGWTCGVCEFCLSGRENLCDRARFTGYQIDGGFAEYTVADQRFCFPIPSGYTAVQAAPLLCAGLIGYRALRMAGSGKRLGLYGFGAAAHIICQVASHKGMDVYAFSRPGDQAAQRFAMEVGAVWAGDSTSEPPVLLDAALIFAPVGSLVTQALKRLAKGGTVVCAGIHMSDIPGFPYGDLWGERMIRSVANLTRQDGDEFLALAPLAQVKTHTVAYPLSRANKAIQDLRGGTIEGAAVLVPD